MHHKLEKYLYKKYPVLFEEHSLPMIKTSMCWGISCENGWLMLLDNLCYQITNHIEQQHQLIIYVKEQEKKYFDMGNPIDVRPNNVKEKVQQVKFKQVKEKFGMLRVYFSGGDETIKNMVNFAENLSKYICEECGKFDATVGKTTKGWLRTVCYDCNSVSKKNNNSWKLFKQNKELSNILKRSMESKKKNLSYGVLEKKS